MGWRSKLTIAPAYSATWRSKLTITPAYISDGGLGSDAHQPRPPTYISTRARKAKRRDRGFNFRAAAAIVSLSLLDKLPPARGGDHPLSGLNESSSPAGLEDDEGAGDA